MMISKSTEVDKENSEEKEKLKKNSNRKSA